MRSPLEIAIIPLGRLLKNRRPGDDKSIRHAPELASPESLRVTSTSFPAGGEIPPLYSKVFGGKNVSPQLSWSAVPDETVQLLLVMEDIDVPTVRPSIHMTALFDASITGFAEGALTTDNPDVRFIASMPGRQGYYGPRPLPGHGPHKYSFYLFALSQPVPADAPLKSVQEVLPLVAGHVVASGGLTGHQEG